MSLQAMNPFLPLKSFFFQRHMQSSTQAPPHGQNTISAIFAAKMPLGWMIMLSLCP